MDDGVDDGMDDPVPEFGEPTPEKRAGEAASAAAALPLVLELVPNVRSLVHVGFRGGGGRAGAGRLGVPEVRGIDGPWAAVDGSLIGPEQVTIVDTRRPF